MTYMVKPPAQNSGVIKFTILVEPSLVIIALH